MNLLVDRVGPTKPSHIVLGGFYHVKGTDRGRAIPEQVIRVLSPPTIGTALGIYTCRAVVWMSLPGLAGVASWTDEAYPLQALNITESGDHGLHDRHLERITESDMYRRPEYRGLLDQIPGGWDRFAAYLGRKGPF